MKSYPGLNRQRAVGDLSPDVSRICVEHQFPTDWVVVLAVSAELSEYVTMRTRGGPPRLRAGTRRHEVFLNGLLVQVLSTPSIGATPEKQVVAMLLG